MHTITHCFFSQAVYIRLTLDISFMHQCMLNKAHVCTHYAKSGTQPHPSFFPRNTTHACTQLSYISATILILPSTTSIALIIMLLCNVS